MILTFDSIQQLVIWLVVAALIVALVRKVGKLVAWVLGVLIFLELGFVAAHTPANNYLPLREVFRWDVVSSVASIYDTTGLDEAVDGGNGRVSQWIKGSPVTLADYLGRVNENLTDSAKHLTGFEGDTIIGKLNGETITVKVGQDGSTGLSPEQENQVTVVRDWLDRLSDFVAKPFQGE